MASSPFCEHCLLMIDNYGGDKAAGMGFPSSEPDEVQPSQNVKWSESYCFREYGLVVPAERLKRVYARLRRAMARSALHCLRLLGIAFSGNSTHVTQRQASRSAHCGNSITHLRRTSSRTMERSPA